MSLLFGFCCCGCGNGYETSYSEDFNSGSWAANNWLGNYSGLWDFNSNQGRCTDTVTSPVKVAYRRAEWYHTSTDTLTIEIDTANLYILAQAAFQIYWVDTFDGNPLNGVGLGHYGNGSASEYRVQGISSSATWSDTPAIGDTLKIESEVTAGGLGTSVKTFTNRFYLNNTLKTTYTGETKSLDLCDIRVGIKARAATSLFPMRTDNPRFDDFSFSLS
jgi:hypothetical protein